MAWPAPPRLGCRDGAGDGAEARRDASGARPRSATRHPDAGRGPRAVKAADGQPPRDSDDTSRHRASEPEGPGPREITDSEKLALPFDSVTWLGTAPGVADSEERERCGLCRLLHLTNRGLPPIRRPEKNADPLRHGRAPLEKGEGRDGPADFRAPAPSSSLHPPPSPRVLTLMPTCAVAGIRPASRRPVAACRRRLPLPATACNRRRRPCPRALLVSR